EATWGRRLRSVRRRLFLRPLLRWSAQRGDHPALGLGAWPWSGSRADPAVALGARPWSGSRADPAAALGARPWSGSRADPAVALGAGRLERSGVHADRPLQRAGGRPPCGYPARAGWG